MQARLLTRGDIYRSKRHCGRRVVGRFDWYESSFYPPTTTSGQVFERFFAQLQLFRLPLFARFFLNVRHIFSFLLGVW